MKYILILQWPGVSEEDYDALITMEETLEEALDVHGCVDGHDSGSGEMNIFVETDEPEAAFADAASALGATSRWRDVRVAYRRAAGGPYAILWPRSLRDFSVK